MSLAIYRTLIVSPSTMADASQESHVHLPDDQEPAAFLLTIAEWKTSQLRPDGLNRLLALVEAQRVTNSNVWICLATPEQLQVQWAQLEARRDEAATLPLWGVPFAVKDNIDAIGFPTTAACPSFAQHPATTDSPVVANLKAAGAVLIGKTNLDQFATGLVGTRSPFGAVSNAFDTSRVSGGSSSGSAVVVSRGIVPFSLGTDTAGSGRVPAGLNNVIGLKPTRGAISARGVVPACRSLDCVSIFALTLDDAETVLRAAEGFDEHDSYSRKRPERAADVSSQSPAIAICANPRWFGKTEHQHAYQVALDKARRLSWRLEEVDFAPLFELAQLLYEGPWVAERYAAIRDFIDKSSAEDMDPVVRAIILKAKKFSATDTFIGEYRRQELTREIDIAFASFEAILVPTTPTFPTLEEVAREPVVENSILGTYTNFVNFLDWTALSIPAGFRTDGLPFGITLIARRWEEPRLLELGHRWLAGEGRLLGATGVSFEEPVSAPIVQNIRNKVISLVVVGAHLSGFPLSKDLISRGAELSSITTTSARYRLFDLEQKGATKKPGLKRVTGSEQGTEIEVEVWSLPEDQLWSFMSTIPHPLALGSVELKDGNWHLGFVCEPVGLECASDITDFGGWRAYTAHLARYHGKASSPSRRIQTVLIANRGEIAARIIRTLRTMGLTSVAIYSDMDASSPHVRSADVALHLEGSSVSETYLNGARILELAKSEAVDAVIPGYGFLAENADFAAAVEAAGIVWIGPTPEQMRQLGLKHTARDIASTAGVPVLPGSDRLLSSIDEALASAEKVGYPVMLKSTAGGGGIGLRRCDDAAALTEALDGAQRLAKANFGDGGVFLEHFVQRAKHIEIQVLGDGTGRVLTAGERDCSLQRRHQKVVEESPAPVLPGDIRARMRKAAEDLAAAVKYRNVGTVEFIYDVDMKEFYFLEVNTRLQVEHPVTESVTGLDLVECMVRIASGDCDDLFTNKQRGVSVTGSSIELRVYAESPLQDFRPTSGRVLDVQFPSQVRVDTWVERGTEITSSYDPLIAKIIATGDDRQAAMNKLAKALAEMRITGVESNLEYLRQIVKSEFFLSGNYTTNSLATLEFHCSAFEVCDAGPATTIQDYPGRTGLWHVGIPPSGPMDDYSFRLANRLVGNPVNAAGLECALQGPTLRFHNDTTIAVTGSPAPVYLNGQLVKQNSSLYVRAGQTLTIGATQDGYRMYVAIRGGINVPLVLGSRSLLELGNIGGYNGRKLQEGDIIHTYSCSSEPDEALLSVPAIPISSEPSPLWTIGVIPGPHGAPDFFTYDGLDALFSGEWQVHYNSNRLGVRLTGPKPHWARRTGGEAGLHPSNIHDSPYSVGSVSFTGDEAVVLTCDGPSLGGFVVFCVVAKAEMWKLGQVRPGHRIRFHMMTVEEAIQLDDMVTESIEKLIPIPRGRNGGSNHPLLNISSPSTVIASSNVIGDIGCDGMSVLVRQAGDCAMLLEFGTEDGFDLRQSLAIFAFMERHRTHPILGVEELTPGVRVLHAKYAMGILPIKMLDALASHSYVIPSRVSSRKIHLPLAFNESACQEAIQRYAMTIRQEAPWLPSNVKFLEALNGLGDGAVEKILNEAEFLVLGLGDVFMGSPCAVPLDRRHRLFGTKYNPSRSFTPAGAVGIGGQYLCIYATESPGGYQLVGRTVKIWDEERLAYVHDDEQLIDRNSRGANVGSRKDGVEDMMEQPDKPWLFRPFDRICFYSVEESQIDDYNKSSSWRSNSLIRVEEDGLLDLDEYEAWLEENKKDIEETIKHRTESIAKAPFFDELLKPYVRKHVEQSIERNDVEIEGEKIRAIIPGRCFKCSVVEGDEVRVGDALVWIESNKMEIKISSQVEGRVVGMRVKEGDLIAPGEVLAVVAPFNVS
ncbi:urea carboxylase [Hypoxylon crocopeplum]|nr:urea carboxylase [Hypoxylon crocopeplum]